MDRAGTVSAIFEQGWNAQRFDVVAPALSEFRFHVGGRSRTMDLGELGAIVRSWHQAFPTCSSRCMP